MFARLFSSKRTGVKEPEQQGAAGRSLSPSTESASVSASAATGAPGSPSRVPLPHSRSPTPVLDPVALQSLIKSCPSKTLQSYVVAQLELATPRELHGLSHFFGDLKPPPRMHCVRCHNEYFEVENSDRSCTLPHDDESAEVEHVGYAKSKAAGAYETRWECCGKTVEGDGDLGPPSGWCYEGKHTIDRKRARYRNDSTPTNDLLQSCEQKGCHRKQYAQMRSRVPVADDARSTRSVRSARSTRSESEQKSKKRTPRKRTQKMVQEEDAADDSRAQDVDSALKKKKRKVMSRQVSVLIP